MPARMTCAAVCNLRNNAKICTCSVENVLGEAGAFPYYLLRCASARYSTVCYGMSLLPRKRLAALGHRVHAWGHGARSQVGIHSHVLSHSFLCTWNKQVPPHSPTDSSCVYAVAYCAALLQADSSTTAVQNAAGRPGSTGESQDEHRPG